MQFCRKSGIYLVKKILTPIIIIIMTGCLEKQTVLIWRLIIADSIGIIQFDDSLIRNEWKRVE